MILESLITTRPDCHLACRASQCEDLWLVKYSLLGNTFLLVDETRKSLSGDREKPHFARWALDDSFGIGGADNIIYLEQLTAREKQLYSFRIFEKDGSETLSCGNGLLCAAALLAQVSVAREWKFLAEQPTGSPRAVRAGIRSGSNQTWAAMGAPRATPVSLFQRTKPVPSDGIDHLEDIRVEIPEGRDWSRGLPASIGLRGSLVFTGEPHAVFVLGHGVPTKLGKLLFPHVRRDGEQHGKTEDSVRLLSVSRSLLEHIGAAINSSYKTMFPLGVHVNFVQMTDQAGVLEYRTWERAINQETLACGTGALACAHICGTRYMGEPPRRFTLLPHRARWYRPDAALQVIADPTRLVLEGTPALIYAGRVPSAEEFARRNSVSNISP